MKANILPAAGSTRASVLPSLRAWLGDAGFVLSLGLIFLMLLAAVSAYLSIEMNQRVAQGGQAGELHVINLRLNNALIDAETAQRGFLLTADSSFLEAYREAERRVPELTTKLVELTSGNAIQQAAARQARELANAKIADLSRAIDLQIAGKPSEAIEQIRGDYGYRNLDALRTILDGLTAGAEQVAGRAREASSQARIWLISATMIGLVLSAALSYVAIARERRRLTAMRREHRTLADLNAVLEQRVEERTAELVNANAEVERERDQVKALLADVNHRIGNNLQLVSSMLGLHARMAQSEETRTVLHAARNQVQSIASAQRRLRMIAGTDQVELAPFFETLIQDVRDTLTSETPVTIELEVTPAIVTSKTAVSLGAIINELIANAIKHGFPGGRPGTVRVFASVGEGDDIRSVVVEDDGIGATRERDDGTGLGGKIVRSLAHSLDVELTVSQCRPGTEYPGTRVELSKRQDSESEAA